jgi:L-threonylcarbamoyladenylate synthase
MRIFEEKEIQEAASLLKEGQVLAFPTETVYGVGVVYDSKEAFQRLVDIKRRPPDKPFAMMCASLEQSLPYIQYGNRSLEFAKRVLPGEVTLLLPTASVPEWVDLKTGVIGLRVPDSPYVKALIEEAGKPLLVTSANHSGEATCKTFQETVEALGDELPGIVRGKCVSLLPTTIVMIKGNELKLVREGPIPFESLRRIWEECQ